MGGPRRLGESLPLSAASPAEGNGRFDSRQLLGELISGEPGDNGSDPGRKRGVATTRRMVYTIAALLALTLVGAGVAYARTGNGGKPAAAPSSGPATSAEALVAKGPSFFDPLSAPGRFQAGSDDTGSCTFDGKGLRAKSASGSTHQCHGPGDSFSGSQTITVETVLSSAGSCAMIWFRHRDLHGYELTACADSLELLSAGSGLPESLGRVPATALQPGTRHQLSIAVDDNHATVSIDGILALQAALDDPTLLAGGVALGVTSSAGPAGVLFANLDVR
jgi:hypothetical protein